MKPINPRLVVLKMHRYSGLFIAVFLIVAALTGSLLVFNQELDEWINRDLADIAHQPITSQPSTLTHSPLSSSTLSVALLHDTVISTYPDYKFSSMPTEIDPYKNAIFLVDYVWGEEAENLPQSPFNMVYVNPYSGEIVGVRDTTSWTWRNVMPKVFELHRSLLLGDAGRLLLGVVALIWTMNCFIGFYLTLPRTRRKPIPVNKSTVLSKTANQSTHSAFKQYLKRWRSAWRIRRKTNLFKFSYDAHHAFGLWLWVMFLVLAWSSVKFNLNPVYDPVMEVVVGLEPWSAVASPPANDQLSIQDNRHLEALKLQKIGTNDVSTAQSNLYAVTKANSVAFVKDLAQKEAQKAGADIEQTLGIRWINEPSQQWQMRFKTDKDVGKYSGASSITVDALTGEVVRVNLGFKADKAHQLDYWLSSLHMGQIGTGFGHRLYQVFLVLVGGIVVLLSITGVYMWWRRKKGDKKR